MIGKEDGKISEAITRYIVALYWQSPLLHFESSAFAFSQMTKVPLRGQKSVRNQSETRQKPAKRNHLFPSFPPSLSLSFSLSLPLCPATRTPTPIPTPTPTPTPTTTATSTTTTTTTTSTTTTKFSRKAMILQRIRIYVFVTIHYIMHNLYFMYMIWSTKNKPFRDCSLWYRGCYAIGWAIEGCPGKGILDNPQIYLC